MKIEKLNNNSWRIRKQYNGKKYIITVPYKPTQKEAIQLMAERLENEPVHGRDTFKSAFDQYIDIKDKVLSPATIRGYKATFNLIPAEFSNMNLSDITEVDIQKVINDYSADHSPKTVRNMYGIITAVLALKRPAFTFRCTLPQKIKKEAYIPTEFEAKRIFNAIKGSEYEVAIKLAAMGLRRSEICALTNADLTGNCLRINKALVENSDLEWVVKTTKTEESTRTIYIPDELVQLIHERGFYHGHPGCITKYLARVQDELKIKHFTLHKLRHFYASEAHAAGIPDVYIMNAGGWKSTKVLDTVYKHAMKDKNQEMQEKAAAKISNLF